MNNFKELEERGYPVSIAHLQSPVTIQASGISGETTIYGGKVRGVLMYYSDLGLYVKSPAKDVSKQGEYVCFLIPHANVKDVVFKE